MKKRNIFAILASLAAVLIIFTACNGKEKPEEPSTVVGADGQVYEEVTEIVSEIVSEVVSELKTEIVTEIRTEPKTDKKGEAVTNNKGVTEVVTEVVTEIVSEIVTEIKTEVVTEVITQTVPYTETTTVAETTTAEQTTAGTSEEISIPAEEEVPFPEGELIEVPMNPDGQPKDPLMKRIMNASAESKQLYLDCVIITGETLGMETGMPCKVYMSGNSMATEFSYGALKLRMVVHDGSVSMLFPVAKAYYQVGDAADADIDEMDMGIWESIGSAEMNYVSTSTVKVGRNTYTCETYNDSVNENRYYFDSKQQLKRIEVETPEGDVSIIKVNSCSSSVNKNIFEIPKGYTKLTEEALQGMIGSLQ